MKNILLMAAFTCMTTLAALANTPDGPQRFHGQDTIDTTYFGIPVTATYDDSQHAYKATVNGWNVWWSEKDQNGNDTKGWWNVVKGFWSFRK